MKHPFSEKIEGQIEIIVKEEYPNEICGFIIDDEFIQMKNIAEDPVRDFRIDEKEYLRYKKKIKAIIHSHADYPHLSKTDMVQQIATALPCGVAFVDKGYYEGMVYFGDQVIPYPLKERQFIHGVFDCYSLVRDYYRIERNVAIPIFPRDNFWWEKDPSLLKDHCEEAGFDYIDESQAKEGDVFFMQLRAPVINHSGIYLGNGEIIHHLYNKLSRQEPLGRWTKYITDWLRYVK
jgi:proteasome lid subunit RPN8/RPN11